MSFQSLPAVAQTGNQWEQDGAFDRSGHVFPIDLF